MSEDSIRNELDRLRRELSKLEGDRSTANTKAGNARRDARRIFDSIRSSTSESMARSKVRQAEQKEKTAEREEKKVADLGKKITDKEKKISTAEGRLTKEIERKRKAAGQEEKRRQDKERAHQAKLLREREASDRRRRFDLQRDAHLAGEIERRVERYSSALDPAQLRGLPTEIKVLIFASDPSDQDQLDLGQEARSIVRRIERAKHRDAVRVEHALAAQPLDLLDYIGKHSPTILHFSGHSSASEGLAFRSTDGETKMVSPEALASAISVSAESVKLIVLNSCESADIALSLVDYVDLAVGMSASILDSSAEVFSARFYGSIADGMSVARAFEQACVALQLEGASDFEVPSLCSRDGVDPDEVVFVRPPDEDHMAEAA